MDGELWNGLYRIVTELGKSFASPGVQYRHAVIVLVYLWSVWHDRPVSWACRQEHWSEEEQVWPKPSPATMSRRLRTPGVQAFLDEVQRRAQRDLSGSCWGYLDGKPLPIGGASHDPDAGFGRAAGGTQAKGYKLHTLWDSSGAVRAWEVTPMQISEVVVARRLVQQLAEPGLILADAGYDDNLLYEQASAQGQQLLAAPRYPRARGLGHIRQSLARCRALRMMKDGLGFMVWQSRRRIERQFGSLGNFSGGLGPLPNWVRRLPRVRRWVQGKLIFNALRLRQNKGLAA